MHGKIYLTAVERRTLVGGLLENVGIDKVVRLGKLEEWLLAVAARCDGDASANYSDGCCHDPVESHKNIVCN